MLRYTLLLVVILAACTNTTSVEEEPTFYMSLEDLRIELSCDTPTDLAITIDRANDFDEPIEIGVMGIGDISDYADVDVEYITLSPDETSGTLTFRASKTYLPRVVGVTVFAQAEYRRVEEPLFIDLLCEEDPFSSQNEFLDPNFGDKGIVITTFSGDDVAYDLTTDAGGKVVAVGGTFSPSQGGASEGEGDFAVARYNPDGLLDTTFGEGGKVTTDFGNVETASAVAIDAGGRIVVAGDTRYGSRFVLARYSIDGSLDESFGNKGRVTLDDSEGGGEPNLAIDVEGRIVVAGENILLRLDADGSLDTSFGFDGLVITTFNITALELDQDNNIVVAGEGRRGEGKFFVARYDSDGSLDTNFANDGVVTTDFGGNDSAYALALDETSIVVGGYTTNNVDFALARYNADGSPDTDFGQDGKVTTNFGLYSSINDLAFDQNSNLLAAGYIDGDFGLARYKPNGSLDTSFGSDGAVTDIFSSDGGGAARALTLTPDGKIVMAGYEGGSIGRKLKFAVVRVLP